MIKTKFLTVLLALLFGQIYGSFPFDLTKILDSDVKYPNIIEIQLEDLSKRPIGTYPENHESPSIEVAEETVVAPSLALPTPFPRVEPCEAITPSPISLIKKRKRNSRIQPITADMTTDEIIEIEVKERGYTKEEKRRQFRKTLQLIAQNDRAAFDADENNFKAVFGKLYTTFKKDDTEFYLLRFMIVFGAENLIKRHMHRFIMVTDEKYRFLEAINYLLKTKPLNVIIEIFTQSLKFLYEEETVKKTIKAIKDQHPNLPYFKNLFVESLNISNLSVYKEIFLEDDERIAFKLIPGFYRSNQWRINHTYCDMKFQKTALHFPEYYLELDENSKFFFILSCLAFDDVESLESLIELYPEIVSYINISIFQANCETNILHEAITNSAIKCIGLLVDIVPEFITASSPKMKPALEFAISNENTYIYEIFYNLGYNESFILEGSRYNLIQQSFNSHSFNMLSYFIKKVGPEIVRREIQIIWETTEKILRHTSNCHSFGGYVNFKPLIIELFSIDINATDLYKFF